MVQSFDIWYVSFPSGPLPKLFIWCPWGQYISYLNLGISQNRLNDHFLFSGSSNYSIPWLASLNLGCISLKFGSLFCILYDQYREIGRKPSQEFRNMKSDLLSLILLDDRVRKMTCPCPFCTCKYELTLWADSLDSALLNAGQNLK